MKSVKPLTTLFLFCVLTGCTSGKNEATVIDANAILNMKGATSSEKAEQLARAAEQLMTPNGIPYAIELADIALSVDPSNKRAQFYSHVLSPIAAQKGIVARAKNLVEKDEYALAKLNLELPSFPDGALKSFFTEGPSDINSESDVQAHLDRVYNSHENLWSWLKENRDLKMTLYVSDALRQSRVERVLKECAVKKMERSVYEVQPCNQSKTLEVTITGADMEAMRMHVAASALSIIGATAYDVTGAHQLAVDNNLDIDSRTKSVSRNNEQIARVLENTPGAGRLRQTQNLSKILLFGNDAVAGTRELYSQKGAICPGGREAEDSRWGFIFNAGICVGEGTKADPISKILATIERALQGKAVKITTGNTQTKWVAMAEGWVNTTPSRVTTSFNPRTLIDNPIEDLKTVAGQTIWSPCDELESIQDSTLGGAFPAGDVNEVIQSLSVKTIRQNGSILGCRR